MTITNSERRIAGANIRRLRIDADESLTALAAALDIERTYFHDIENGSANATFEKYERIAKRFGVTVRDLLTEHRPSSSKGKRKELTGSRK